MKKNYYLPAVMLLATVLWISCKKGTNNQSNISNVKTSVSLTSQEIGVWHNKALSLIKESTSTSGTLTNSLGGKANFIEIRERILQELIKNDPNTFKENEIKASLSTLDKINTSAEIQTYNKGESIDKMGSIINALKTQNAITQKLALELEKIHILSRSGVSAEKVREAVNILQAVNFKESEKKYVETFVAVYNSSYDYWLTNKTTNNTDGNTKKTLFLQAPTGCNQIIITADTAGALYGMITGPITSAVEAAAFSYLASINPPCENY